MVLICHVQQHLSVAPQRRAVAHQVLPSQFLAQTIHQFGLAEQVVLVLLNRLWPAIRRLFERVGPLLGRQDMSSLGHSLWWVPPYVDKVRPVLPIRGSKVSGVVQLRVAV